MLMEVGRLVDPSRPASGAPGAMKHPGGTSNRECAAALAHGQRSPSLSGRLNPSTSSMLMMPEVVISDDE